MNLKKLKTQASQALGHAVESATRARDTVLDAVRVRRLPDPLSHPEPGEGVSLEVPGYAQTLSYNCGVIVGWIVVESLWPKRSFERFHRLVSPDPEYGTPTKQLVVALKQSRIGVARCRPTFPKIKEAIDGGFPVIACIDRPGKGYRHWVVIYGYGLAPKRVYVAGNRWARLVRPNVLGYPEFRSLCTESLLVCWGE